MQRKRRRYNTERIKYYLHSIPKLLLITKLKDNNLNTNNNVSVKNVKSNVLYSIPSVVVLVFLFGLIMTFNPAASSSEVYAVVETKGDSTASMTLDTSNVVVDTTPGTYAYVSKDISLSINNAESYSLTITAPSVLSNGNDSSSVAEFWGYAYESGVADLPLMSYKSFDGSAQVLEDGSDITSLTSNKILAIGAGFSDDAIPGHYIAEITLSLAATPKLITHTLTLDPNGGTGGTTTKTCETYDSSCSISLSDVAVPSRTGYTFLGWADSNTATSAQYTTNGTNGTANAITLSATNTSNQVKAVYAVWKSVIFNDITTMQEMTSSICSNATEDETAQLRDTRDDKIYWVTKLRDGKCWMTQNLAYNGGGGTKQCELNGGDTCTGWPRSGSVSSTYAVGDHINGDHASQGNYYSYPAAQKACPDNWQLPARNLFSGLMSAYGISDGVNITQITDSPLYFMRSGLINGYYANHNLVDSNDGYAWSSSMDLGTTMAYPFRFDSSSVTSSQVTSYYLGMPVRCIAK